MINNKQLECLIENANEDYEIDISLWVETAQKLFRNLMTHDGVGKESCLAGLEADYDEIFFDITFTNAIETHELNKTYRDKDYAADIITFALFADDETSMVIERRIVLGDIIIALDKVDEMAKESGKSFDYELKFLIAHGILHLLGFDHQTEQEYNFVVKHQIEAIKELENDEV